MYSCRDRFLSLFLTASIVLQKEVGLKAALLSLWMDVIEKLIVCHKDYFTANALANGICVDQVRFFSLLSRFVHSNSTSSSFKFFLFNKT